MKMFKTIFTIILAFIFFPLAMWYEARYVKGGVKKIERNRETERRNRALGVSSTDSNILTNVTSKLASHQEK